MYQDEKTNHDVAQICIECGSAGVSEQIKEQRFAYGSEENQVLLTASMSVFTCAACGYEYFDERGETARHAAVCRHLGVHTPEEIRHIREGMRLTRADFCRLTGFGSASLQRWESGLLVPSFSNDKLIYLLRYPDNVERLMRRINHSEGAIPTVLGSAEPVVSAVDSVCEVRTRSAVRQFNRFTNRTRVLNQANEWNLRRTQCM